MKKGLSDVKVSFKYDGNQYYGVDGFDMISEKGSIVDNVVYEEYVLKFLDNIDIVVQTEYNREFNAFGYTVWFENKGNANSKVFSDLFCADAIIQGGNPVLKGILGDHVHQYKPYEINLKVEEANFKQETGRATHVVFPYFLLETDNGSSFMALGWAGTWSASFRYEDEGARFVAKGVNNLCTYLKPGEKIRTPLVLTISTNIVRDTEKAMNLWRRWFVKYNMPPVSPMITNWLALDTGRPNSDGSISEYYGSWKPSMDKYYAEGLHMDIRWVDAGWYVDPENKTVPTDWWGTVGTWILDREKWPGDSFRESIEYAEKRGAKTMMWFEPERVTNVKALSRNFGFKKAWILENGGPVMLANLAIPECVEYLTDRITGTMDEHGVHMYREDFNCDPAGLWAVGDGKEEGQRDGITENLYIQGHYRLWDNIIAYCKRTNKLPFIDSCASGGGRNDLESMRRAVPFLRSDSDRTSTGLRLAMTTSFMQWIPCCGASTKETTEQLTAGKPDIYVLRASYLPIFNYSFEYTQDKDLDYDTLRQAQKEWMQVKKYFYDDFYILTPWHPEPETDKWTVYMFINPTTQEGVIQAFRQERCEEESVTLKVRGVEADKYYTITDVDGRNSVKSVKGSDLAKGFAITLPEKRMAAILFIAKEQ